MIIKHPTSKVPIKGLRIGPGTVLGENDYYANPITGDWELATWGRGTTLPSRVRGVYVRKDAALSLQALQLLVHIEEAGCVLVETPWWRGVKSPEHKNERSSEWRIPFPAECVQELRDFLYLKRLEEDSGIWEITETGRAFCREVLVSE